MIVPLAQQGVGREPLRGGLCHAKIHDPRRGNAVDLAYQNVGRF